MNDIESRMRKGVEALDAYAAANPTDPNVMEWEKAGGWREILLDAFRHDKFNMASMNRCVLGLLFWSYYEGRNKLFGGPEWVSWGVGKARSHGFTPASTSYGEWANLQAAWNAFLTEYEASKGGVFDRVVTDITDAKTVAELDALINGPEEEEVIRVYLEDLDE